MTNLRVIAGEGKSSTEEAIVRAEEKEQEAARDLLQACVSSAPVHLEPLIEALALAAIGTEQARTAHGHKKILLAHSAVLGGPHELDRAIELAEMVLPSSSGDK